MRRVIVGGILGGLVLFVWSFVSHDLLPLGTAGLRTMAPAQEAAVLSAMRGAMNEQALYLFPGMDPSGKMTKEQQHDWSTRYADGPAGVIGYNPHPAARASAEMLFPTLFITELLCDVLAGLIAAVVISHVPSRLGLLRRALLVGLLGVLMTVDVDFSYWNWYGFPMTYTLAQLIDHGVGYCLVGLVVAGICHE